MVININTNAKSLQILKKFVKDVIDKVDEIINRAIKENENGVFTMDYEDLDEEVFNDVSSFELVKEMLFARDEVLENAQYDNEIRLYLKEQFTNYTSDYEPNHFNYDDSYHNEIEVLYARHLLWLYGTDRDGEQADFTDCTFRNIDFSHKNLCSAIFKGAEFINCIFDNASMCSVDFRSAKFKKCSLKHFGAEEANFKDAEFSECDLKTAYFTHSNFTDSTFYDCCTFETDFTNCCLDSWTCENINLEYTFFDGVSYSENEWLQENNENEDEDNSIIMGGM